MFAARWIQWASEVSEWIRGISVEEKERQGYGGGSDRSKTGDDVCGFQYPHHLRRGGLSSFHPLSHLTWEVALKHMFPTLFFLGAFPSFLPPLSLSTSSFVLELQRTRAGGDSDHGFLLLLLFLIPTLWTQFKKQRWIGAYSGPGIYKMEDSHGQGQFCSKEASGSH